MSGITQCCCCCVDDDADDDSDTGDCLVVDCSQLSVKSYWLGSYPNSPILDMSWSLDASRLITVNAAVRFLSPSLFLSLLDYFVCVRLFSCIISACMLYYCDMVR